MFRRPMVMWYGPCLKGRYGFGLVVWTSQLRAGGAVGRWKSIGSHTITSDQLLGLQFGDIFSTSWFPLRSFE
jgi:hypothetical protein